MRIALIGATGLIGRQLLPLLETHERLVFTRRPIGYKGGGLVEVIAPMQQWPDLVEGPVDVAVSTLGTTWKKAGSWPAFEAVDRVAVVEFERAARAAGARQMISVSSVGADPSSSNRYLGLKGKVERDLREIGFERVDIFRPGLLKGERGSDRRFAERLGILVSPLLNLFLQGPLERFAAIDAALVAQGIAAVAGASDDGVFVHHNREIRALGHA